MAKKKKAAAKPPSKKAGKKSKPQEGLSRAEIRENMRAKTEKENGPVPPANSGIPKGKKAKKTAKKADEPQKPTTPPHLSGPPGLTRR